MAVATAAAVATSSPALSTEVSTSFTASATLSGSPASLAYASWTAATFSASSTAGNCH